VTSDLLDDTIHDQPDVEMPGAGAAARTSSSSVKDTFSSMSLSGVFYALAARRTSEAWRSP
jgi:hypothetical protein